MATPRTKAGATTTTTTGSKGGGARDIRTSITDLEKIKSALEADEPNKKDMTLTKSIEFLTPTIMKYLKDKDYSIEATVERLTALGLKGSKEAITREVRAVRKRVAK